MEVFDTIAMNQAKALLRNRLGDVNEQAIQKFRNEQQALGTPLHDKASVIMESVLPLIPYEKIITPVGLFFKNRNAERERQALREKPANTSAYGYLDGNPQHMVLIEQFIPGEPEIRHNGTLLFSFCGLYVSQVGALTEAGTIDALLLDQGRFAEIDSYLDQIASRVQWQEATQLPFDSAGGHRFEDRIAPGARGDMFLSEFTRQ